MNFRAKWNARQLQARRTRGSERDYDWLGEAHSKYPEAFEKTMSFISSVESDAQKVGMESGKIISISNGGMLFLIVFAIASWATHHAGDDWLTSRIVWVDRAFGLVFCGSVMFVVLEIVRFFANTTATFNPQIMDRTKEKWDEILSRKPAKDFVSKQIDLFIARERAKNVRLLTTNASGNWTGSKLFVALQCACVVMSTIGGFVLLDANVATSRLVAKEKPPQEMMCRPVENTPQNR